MPGVGRAISYPREMNIRNGWEAEIQERRVSALIASLTNQKEVAIKPV
jgi:hypothetical protein